MMMEKEYTSPAGPIWESLMTSGAVHLGLVVLDNMMLPPLFIILQDMGMNNWIFRILSRGKVLN
jgi:hypothetical protein